MELIKELEKIKKETEQKEIREILDNTISEIRKLMCKNSIENKLIRRFITTN